LKPIRYELGEIIIRPRWPGAPPEKVVLAMRIHVDPETKPYFPYYFDFTSRRGVAMLQPMIDRIIVEGLWLHICKRGVAPKAWFEIEAKPERPVELPAGLAYRP